jgi:energy-converting hydrogenase Eha subunit A
VLGALFPDTDTDSKGQNLFYAALAVLDLALIIQRFYQWAAFLGFCSLLPAIGRHRGWTHTWWAMLIAPSPIVLLPLLLINAPVLVSLPLYAAAVLGYFSHLLLDRKFR